MHQMKESACDKAAELWQRAILDGVDAAFQAPPRLHLLA